MTSTHATDQPATHMTAATRFIHVGGVRVAFRRFGSPGAPPLLTLQHFRGNLDNWDPALTDALADRRPLMLVDYPGVGASSGEFGRSIADTARRMIAFAEARHDLMKGDTDARRRRAVLECSERPSVYDLWRGLRAVTREIRPDWDLATPGLREPWDAGDQSSFHGWDRWSPERVAAERSV
jgi:hypothetical protein